MNGKYRTSSILGQCGRIACILLAPTIAAAWATALWFGDIAEMLRRSDLVVVGIADSSREVGDKAVVALEGDTHKEIEGVGVDTRFDVLAVLKGLPTTKHVVLHHYRLQNGARRSMVGGPFLVSFEKANSLTQILFLKKDAAGRLAPVTGQSDARWSVVLVSKLSKTDVKTLTAQSAQPAAVRLRELWQSSQHKDGRK